MHRYSKGDLLLIAGEGGVALLRDAPPAVRVAVAEALRGTCDFGAFVDSLIASFGVSMSALPPFAVALREGGAMRLVVRGDMTAHAGTVLSGRQASTWVEALAEGDVTVSLGEVADAPGEGDLWIESGAVWAGGAWLDVVRPDAAAAHPVSAAAAAQPTPVVAAAPSIPEQPAPVAAAEPVAAEPVASVDLSVTTLAPEPEPEPASEPVRDPQGADSAAEATDDDFSVDTTFDSLWGATVAKPPAAASAPPDTPAPAPASEPAPESGLPAGVAPAQAPAPAPTAEPAPAPAPAPEAPPVAPPTPAQRPPAPVTPLQGGMISGIPTSFAASAPEPPAAEPEVAEPRESSPAAPASAPAGDHDGATITVAQLRDLAPEAAASEPAQPISAPVPAAYGRAVLSTGQDVTLDRTVIVGRRPKATRVTGEPPHLVAVPSPQQDISRNHVELRLEGSSVVAVDLHTTNGSLLRRGAADPVRLHPGEPTVIVSGDVLDLGDAVTITFVEIP